MCRSKSPRKPTFKALKADPRFLSGLTDTGNKKLINDAFTRYLIWNIPAVKTCPYRTRLCEKSCYALKAESAYPNTKAQRARNFEITKKADFAENMIYTIECHMTRKIMFNKTVYVRVHESGDFYSQRYTNEWLKVMQHFADNKPDNGIKLVFVFYTKSFKYFLDIEKPAGVAAMASIWDDTSAVQKARAAALGWPVYTADTEQAVNAACQDINNFKCVCQNCSTCRACFENLYKYIFCVIH